MSETVWESRYGPQGPIPPPYPPVVTYRDKGLALLVEALSGFFLQTFGIGHLYAGRTLEGVMWMVSYWAIQAVNVLLMFVLVGFVTFPLTYVVYTILSLVSVAKAVDDTNYRLRYGLPV